MSFQECFPPTRRDAANRGRGSLPDYVMSRVTRFAHVTARIYPQRQRQASNRVYKMSYFIICEVGKKHLFVNFIIPSLVGPQHYFRSFCFGFVFSQLI